MRFAKGHLIFLLLFGMMLILIQLLLPNIQHLIELGILFLGLVITGIPHGAIDHYVAKRKSEIELAKFRISDFILRYLCFMMMYGIFWWLFPGISLCFFILLTAYHFGEADFHFFGKRNKLLAFFFGLHLTAWILLSNQAELTNWIKLILPEKDPVFLFTKYLFKIPNIVFLMGSAILSFPGKNKQAEWVLYMLLLLLIHYLGLIGGFAFYFAGWHGWLAFRDIKKYLNSEESNIQLWKKAIPFSALSISGLLLVYLVTPYSVWQHFGAPAVIIMISLLTLPHMQVMHHLYVSKK